MADEERNIFVDQDWKAQVQREKEQAQEEAQKQQAEQSQQEAPEDAGTQAGPGAEAGAHGEEGAPGQDQMPEASFMGLVGSLATQAMLALGVIAPQGAQEVRIDLGQAKYCIDTLAVLRDKTQGNLSEQESSELGQALSELQQLFVARAQQVQEQEMRQAGVDPTNLKGQPPQ